VDQHQGSLTLTQVAERVLPANPVAMLAVELGGPPLEEHLPPFLNERFSAREESPEDSTSDGSTFSELVPSTAISALVGSGGSARCDATQLDPHSPTRF
jgi:hypothetical protein